MSRGWHRESRRHSLASRGIKTSNLSLKVGGKREKIDYENPRSWIFAFWKANIEKDYSNFDFDKVFDYTKRMVDMYIFSNTSETIYLPTKHPWEEAETLSVDEVMNRIDEAESISDMDDIFYDIQAGSSLEWDVFVLAYYMRHPPKDQRSKVLLVDNIIHVYHTGGSLFWDKAKDDFLDIEQLREEFEREYES